MIPQQTLENYPVFGDTATKVKPDDAKYAAGFQPSDVYPAEWVNWAWYKNSKSVTVLNEGVDAIEKEILSILSDYGIAADSTKTNQLLGILKQLKPKFATSNTEASTETKGIAITGNVLKNGDVYIITMTNGNTYGNGSTTYPKLSINNGTAYPLCDANGKYLASGAWDAGEIISVLFTGDKYLKATSGVLDAITTGDKHPATSGAVKAAIDTAEAAAKNLANATGTLAVLNGGTGATDAATARTNLECGTAATKNAGSASGNVPLNGDALGTTNYNAVCTNSSGQLTPYGKTAPQLATFGLYITAAATISSGVATFTATNLNGLTAAAGTVVKVTFTSALASSSAITQVKLAFANKTGVIKAANGGSLQNLKSFDFESGTNRHKVWDAYTTLDLMWTGSEWLIMGNPLVLTGTGYEIYGNGTIGGGALGDIKAIALTAIPAIGWKECDGSAISRTTYKGLYDLFVAQSLLNVYGAGNGSSTFNLPDYREVALVGAGQNSKDSISDHDTYTVGQFKDDQLQDHKHTFSVFSSSSYGGSGYTNGNVGYVSTFDTSACKDCRKGTTTRGKRKGVKYIIKVL